MSHVHECICGTTWSCSVDVLPAPGSRAWCKEFHESFCPRCLDQILTHSDSDGLQSFIELMSQVDPLSAMRARQVVEARLI